MLKKLLISASLVLAASTPAWSQAGQYPSGWIQGNAGASAGQGSPSAVTAIIDRALGSTRGAIIERGAGGWVQVGPGSTAGLAWISGGTGADPAYGVLGLSGGGLGANLTANNGGIFWSNASAGQILAGTATARLPLLSGANATPQWGAYTLPASVTSGGIPYFSSTGAESSSALLVANQIILGGGAGLAPSTLGSLGTTTTVLHGNASGAPSFGAVNLATDIAGSLPLGNGGLGGSQSAATANQVPVFPGGGGAAVPSTLTAPIVNYTAPFTGSVTQTQSAYNAQRVSVKDFGATGNGVTDDTAAMNAAHATGQLIFYPAGTYIFTTLNPIAFGGIIGQGRALTTLKSTDTSSNNLITFNNSANVPLLRDFALTAPQSSSIPVKPNGAGIALNPTSGAFGAAIFDNVTIAFTPIGIDFVAAFNWNVVNCNFVGYNVAGLQVANTNNPDAGDSFILSSLFNGVTTGAGVLQFSSGGLKIVGNKFLGGQNGYVMTLNSTNTGDLLVTGNSFENMTAQDMTFNRVSGTGNFINVIITGNEFGVGPTGIQTDATGFLSEVTITGNVFNLASGAGFGVQLTNVADINIGGNIFKGNGGSPTGISIGTGSTNIMIGTNTFNGMGTQISDATSAAVYAAITTTKPTYP